MVETLRGMGFCWEDGRPVAHSISGLSNPSRAVDYGAHLLKSSSACFFHGDPRVQCAMWKPPALLQLFADLTCGVLVDHVRAERICLEALLSKPSLLFRRSNG